jgi:hypothetical protein
MMPSLWKRAGWLLSSLLLAGSMTFAAPAPTPVPGSLNYVEGQVSLDGRPLDNKSVGSAQLGMNQVLATGQGKAEILLSPGAFLRIGNNSSVRMVSPDLINTQVELQHGEAMLEVTAIYKENNLTVREDGALAKITKRGLYEFNADAQTVAVYDGEAQVWRNDQQIKLKKGRETSLAAPRLRASKFDRNAQDQLYAWSNLRSEYEAQASTQYATFVAGSGWPWWGAGWYWNPYWDMWGFVPGAGFLYSPFGWGFYSPAVIIGGGVPYGYLRGPGAYGRVPAYRGSVGTFSRGFTPSIAGSGFRGGFGGGFHGGFRGR